MKLVFTWSIMFRHPIHCQVYLVYVFLGHLVLSRSSFSFLLYNTPHTLDEILGKVKLSQHVIDVLEMLLYLNICL